MSSLPSPIWHLTDAPSLAGRSAVVTGATDGVGFQVAAGLAGLGASVVLTGRNAARGEAALAAIRHRHPQCSIRFALLDCASLASVARFAASWQGTLDILVNNAAVMALPQRVLTEDGFEQQIGVNYLAHFALTARLCAALNAAENGGRVVNVASLAHRSAVLRLDDLHGVRRYHPMPAYRQSKLAMLMLALELQRRAEAYGWKLRAYAAHPGFARTGIIANGPGGGRPGPVVRLVQRGFNLIAQSAEAGALPILYAATSETAVPGGYFGPDRFGETRGNVAPAQVFPQARDQSSAAALWSLSAHMTGVAFPEANAVLSPIATAAPVG